VFLGRFEVSMDDRGRLAIPKRFQDAFRPEKSTNTESAGENGENPNKPEKVGGQLVISPDAMRSRPCLLIYPLGEWAKVVEQRRDFPDTDEHCQDVETVFGLASYAEMDDKGRFVVPADVLDDVGLSVKTKIYLIGKPGKFELWDKELWDAELAAARAANKKRRESGQLSDKLKNFVM